MLQMIKELTDINKRFKHIELKSHMLHMSKVLEAIKDAMIRLPISDRYDESLSDLLTAKGYVVIRNYCNRYKPQMSSVMTLYSLKYQVPELRDIDVQDVHVHGCTTELQLRRVMNYKATSVQRRMLKPLFDGELEAKKSNAIRRFIASRVKVNLMQLANEHQLDRKVVLCMIGKDDSTTINDAIGILFPTYSRLNVRKLLNEYNLAFLMEKSK